MKYRNVLVVFTLVIIAMLSGCASRGFDPNSCPDNTQKLENCPPLYAVQDEFIETLYQERDFNFSKELPIDLIEFAKETKAPINDAYMKFLGSTKKDAIQSLATRLWMIENAQHTIDVTFYIFQDDFVGKAILGALCNAVKRGIDVRISVDSLGSISFSKKNLKALESCAAKAGFIKNAKGETTIYRARVQSVVINAITKLSLQINRRSHDKLMIIDGLFPEKTTVITGGRNMSLDYYGILENGDLNPNTYRDSDILLRNSVKNPRDNTASILNEESQITLGRVTETYYSILFMYENNLAVDLEPTQSNHVKYKKLRDSFSESLILLKKLPKFSEIYAGTHKYMNSGFAQGTVLLGHELANLTSKNVVSKAVENFTNSPNSIVGIMNRGGMGNRNRIRLVSPYFFSAEHKDDNDKSLVDEAQDMIDWLEKHPQSTIEIITNSVLTSDNFFTQSVIDMNLAPRLLLDNDSKSKWVDDQKNESELEALVNSEQWKKMVSHPRLRIYETGQLNDVLFGGNYQHPKLHAKYITADDVGYVGTSNFDYRSRLYNSEVGFFFQSAELMEELNKNTDYLISHSYRWGSPEWLEMRKRLKAQSGSKAFTVRNQSMIYKTLKNTGLIWFF